MTHEENEAHFFRKRALLFCLAIILFSSSWQLPARAEVSGWENLSYEAMHEFKVFDVEAGIPFLGYMTVAQTPDGFLYAGGYGGLVRYDGKRFERVKGIDSVVSLCVSRDGSLWIGTNSGMLVHMSGNDEMTYYGKKAWTL